MNITDFSVMTTKIQFMQLTDVCKIKSYKIGHEVPCNTELFPTELIYCGERHS